MTTPSDNNNNSSTSYKPFAISNYANNDDDQLYSTRLSAIDEEIIKTTSLLQLKEKLFNLPHGLKSSLVYAQQVTDIVNDDHLLGFLYVENYNVDHALTRLIRYWNTRHKVFGDDYILPLTLYGAMKDNIDIVKRGILVLLPELDDRGRSIIYANLSLRGDGDPDKVIKLWWYLIHVAMERPSCRKNGFIVLSNGQDAKLCHFQPKVYLAVIKTGESTFPIKRQASHVCNPVNFPLVAPAVKAMLSLRQRQTMTFHNGPSNRLLESLAACSLPASAIPDNMGGSLHLSLDELVRARLAIEGQADNIVSEVNRSTSQEGNISDVSVASDSKLPPKASSTTNLTAPELGNISDLSSADQQSESTTSKPTSSKLSPIVEEGKKSDTTEVNSSKKSSVSASSKPARTKVEGAKFKIKTHPGRTGDKRMNKAVDAKRQNPNMTHLDAILAGGFVFPNMYAPGVKLGEAKDLDGVSVNQRKNQLMRRLRTDNAKKKNSKK